MKITASNDAEMPTRHVRTVLTILFVVALLAIGPGLAAQGSRKDDIVLGPEGHPVAGATVRVCQPTATGTPCTPLATLYTDTTLTTVSANPFQTDGLGNYHFYAAAGRYQIQISSPQLSGTVTQPDVILPADLSSSASGNNISAFGLTLGGNLSVAGNTNISGSLSVSSFNPGALSPSSLDVMGSSAVQGPRPYIDVTSGAYGATGDGGAEVTAGSVNAGSNQLTIGSTTGAWKIGMGLYVAGAGAGGDTLLAKVTAINGNVLTLSANASTSVSSAAVQDDDTLAIQEAISTFCGGTLGGSIFFPPGNYSVSQPQSVNPSGVPFTLCSFMHIVGGDNLHPTGTAFAMPPAASIVARCLSSPNSQPLFGSYYPSNNNTFENIAISGCNKAVETNSQTMTFKNAHLSVGTSGLTDNSALHLFNTFWVWIYGGELTGTHSAPDLLLTGDNCGGSCNDTIGDLYVNGTLMGNGNIQYIQRANATGAPPGHWVFQNITQEGGNTDLISITDPGSYAMGGLGPITLDDVQSVDNADGTAAVINFNAAGNTLTGVEMRHVLSGNGPNAGPALKITAGAVQNYNIDACNDVCSTQVINGSGQPVGDGFAQGSAGLDFFSNTSNNQRLNTSPVSNENINAQGPVLRAFQSGSQYASYGIDSANGWMFGSNTQAGWNAQIYQSAAPQIDFAYAANYPPTNVSATVSTTGGSFPSPETYWFYIVSTTANNCTSSGSMSAPSPIYGPVTTTTGSTNAITFTWTPAVAGTMPIQGYCIFVNPSFPQYNSASNTSNLISGASSTGTTLSAYPGNTPGAQPITYQMTVEHQFTPAGAVFTGISTPTGTANPPYAPNCLAAVTCTSFLQLNPFTTDTFSRANSASLGSNWGTAAGGGGLASLAVSSNAATASGSVAGIQSWAGETFYADQFSKTTINTYSDGTSDLVGVTVRGSTTGIDTEYTFHCYHGSSVITKRISGTETTLVSGGADCYCRQYHRTRRCRDAASWAD